MTATQTRNRMSVHPAEIDEEVVYAPNEDRTAGSEGAGRLIGLGELASADDDHPVGPVGPRHAGLLTWTIAIAIVAITVLLTLMAMGEIYGPKTRQVESRYSTLSLVAIERLAG